MKKLLVANWKMNLGPADSASLASKFAEKSKKLKHVDVWIAPSSLSITAVVNACSNSPCLCGSQNIHWAESGAFTGEISAPMLKEAGVKFAIVGHSERRHVFGESDQEIAKRGSAALQHNLKLILCVGEKLEERESGKTHLVLDKQLSLLTEILGAQSSEALVIAYEPVWAIGTGKVAGIEEINEAHSYINEVCSKQIGACPPILYGGSVAPDNFKDISNQPLVSGALVGGASLSYEKFSTLIDIAEST